MRTGQVDVTHQGHQESDGLSHAENVSSVGQVYSAVCPLLHLKSVGSKCPEGAESMSSHHGDGARSTRAVITKGHV